MADDLFCHCNLRCSSNLAIEAKDSIYFVSLSASKPQYPNKMGLSRKFYSAENFVPGPFFSEKSVRFETIF